MPLTAELPEVQSSFRGGSFNLSWDTNTAMALVIVIALLTLLGTRIGPLRFPRP